MRWNDIATGIVRESSGRWWKVGLASIVGGGLLVVTGGLAAPALIAGMGAMVR